MLVYSAHECVLQMSSFLVLRAWRLLNEQDYAEAFSAESLEKPMHLIAIAKQLVTQAVKSWGKSLDSTGNRPRFVRLLRLLRARALRRPSFRDIRPLFEGRSRVVTSMQRSSQKETFGPSSIRA